MIEKYVRASNLWDEITSYYRRKTLARMRRELDQQQQEEEEGEGKRDAVSALRNAFGGLGNLFTGGGARRRRRTAGRRAASSASASSHSADHQQEGGGAGNTAEPWWKSEVLQTALSVATMLILVVLFRRVKVR